jgi:TPR repeat protein
MLLARDASSAEATALVRSAATGGCRAAMLELSQRSTDSAERLRLLVLVSLGGGAEGCEADWRLSQLLSDGSRSAEGQAEALRRLRRAAIAGHARAQVALARAAFADGEPESQEEVARLLRCAAELAPEPAVRATACGLLGLAYVAGTGVARHVGRAKLWLDIAALGEVEAELLSRVGEALDGLATCGMCGKRPGEAQPCEVCQAVTLCGGEACAAEHVKACEGVEEASSSEEEEHTPPRRCVDVSLI